MTSWPSNVGEPFINHATFAAVRLDQVPKIAVARFRLQMAELLKGSEVDLGNPFPPYYPGMPAYDAARKATE